MRCASLCLITHVARNRMKHRKKTAANNCNPIFLVLVASLLGLGAGCSPRTQAPADAAFEHEMQGEIDSHQGRYSAALQEYQTAILINPSGWPAHDRAGRILEQQGRFQEAIAEYHKVIALDYTVKNPADKAWWHFRLAGALYKAGLHQDAVAEYKLTYKIASQDQMHKKKLALLARQSLYLSRKK